MSYYQKIYDRLRSYGLTQAGALALLGNWECESNCEPNRLQGDFSPYRTASKNYVRDVTNGTISRQQFGNDQKGFGIYQLTYPSRKLGYYDYWKSSGKALDDPILQTDYAIKEMPTEAPGLLQELKTSNDLYQCVDDVCRKFERPYYNNVQQRFDAAERIAKMIDLDGGGDTPDPDPDPDPEPRAWPPRTIDREHCTGWTEITAEVIWHSGSWRHSVWYRSISM